VILVVLQNAYGVEDGYVPSYKRSSFLNSHTGRRLSEMLPTKDVEIRNASPIVGDVASSFFKCDLNYLRKEIGKIKPSVILACGVSAKNAIRNLETSIPIIFAPHPAWRRLSKKITSNIRQEVEKKL